MGIVNRSRQEVHISAQILGYIFTATVYAANRRDVVDAMFHIGLSPILGRWKIGFRKDLWKL